MDITCTHDKIQSALEYAERVISRNLTLPILGNILLRVEKKELHISATNLEIGIVASIPCQIKASGSLTVPGKIFYGIVNNLEGDSIHLTSDVSHTLYIESGTFSGEIKGHDAADFPIIPTVAQEALFGVSAEELSRSISQIISFTSVSETRPELTGVFFSRERDAKEIDIVAADGFRLARRKLFPSAAKGSAASFILPQRTAGELARLGSLGGIVDVALEQGQVEFRFEQFRVVSRLIEGAYPDYQALVPTSFNTECVMSRDELSKNIRLVSLLSSRINDIQLSVNNSKLTLSSRDEDTGESTITMDIEHTGEPLTITFNWRYLLEGVQNVDAKRVQCKFIDNTKAGLIRSDKDANYIYVVMPLRV